MCVCACKSEEVTIIREMSSVKIEITQENDRCGREHKCQINGFSHSSHWVVSENNLSR